MVLIVLRRPLTRLHGLGPVLQCGTTLGRPLNLLLEEQVFCVAAAFILNELTIHVLGAIPVCLTATGQTLTAIDFHDMPGDITRTSSQKYRIKFISNYLLFSGQIDDSFANFGYKSYAIHGDVSLCTFLQLEELRLGHTCRPIHIGLHKASCDCVHTHTVRSQL